ncbi:aldehyde dehydrogenase family protein [Paraburkholderia sediminicola]|uniref:aldehyde dehydrogenase family protein n=1 Tax=Paraburkholderia sediminicola TaxID=458836 RepID=UPI0038B7ADF7
MENFIAALEIARGQEDRGVSFVDGQYVPGIFDPSFLKLHPGNGKKILDTRFSSSSTVSSALEIARKAYEKRIWRDVTPSEKRAILLQFSASIIQNSKRLATLDALEMGKTISDATQDAHVTAALITYYAESIDKWFSKKALTASNSLAYNSFEPRGVIGAIVPWNYPTCNAALKIGPSLVAGNSIVLKPSEHAYLSTLLLAELACEAGIPRGVLNVVTGRGETSGQQIARSSSCNMLTFTGSHRTGRQIMAYSAASNGKPMLMECGGKNASIVMPDMKDSIASLAERIAAESFANQGQLCVASSRALVHRDVADSLTEALHAAALTRLPADPLDSSSRFGTIVNGQERDRIRARIALAKEQGARCLVDTSPDVIRRAGSYLNPVVFDQVDPGSDLAQVEVFGPVLAITPFDSIDEAIAIANGTEYGLSATVWTNDFKSIRKYSSQLNVGKLQIRADVTSTSTHGFSLGSEPMGASGFGVEFGMDALNSYSRLMSVEITG